MIAGDARQYQNLPRSVRFCDRYQETLRNPPSVRCTLSWGREFLGRLELKGEYFWAPLWLAMEYGWSITSLRQKDSHCRGGTSVPHLPKNRKPRVRPKKSVFWDRKGIVLIDILLRAITAARYCETLQKLKRVVQTERRGIPTKIVCLLHDNNRPPSYGQRHQGAFELVWSRHFEPLCTFSRLSAFRFSSFRLPEDSHEWKKNFYPMKR